MQNHQKIKTLKNEIKNYIKNMIEIDENLVFNFAKQQAKEMKIEISKGEVKSIVYEIISKLKEANRSYNYNEIYNDPDFHSFSAENPYYNHLNFLL